MASNRDSSLRSQMSVAVIALSIGLGLLTNWLSDFLHRWLALGLAIFLLAVAGMTAWRLWNKISAWLPGTGQRFIDLTGSPAAPAKVLFVGASPAATTGIYHQIRKGQLEHLYIVHTQDAAGHRAAEQIEQYAREQASIAALELQTHRIPVTFAAIHDPKIIREKLVEEYEELLRSTSYGERDILFDYTGGTKSFTAAMTLVGAEGRRRIQYVVPQPEAREQDGRLKSDAPPESFDAIEVDMEFNIRPRRRGNGAHGAEVTRA